MAQVEGNSGGRSTNFELNLVPFIDLMSVMITFLLITAVWTQVSMIQIGSSIYSKKNDSSEPKPPPKLSEIVLRLDVKQDGYRILYGTQPILIPKVNGDYDLVTLKARLESIKGQYPDKEDLVLTMEDNIVYNEMIRGMDISIQTGFNEVSIATGGAQ